MIQYVRATFIAPHDPHYGEPAEEEVVLLAPDITVSVYDEEWAFRLLPAPYNGVINLATCKRFDLIGMTAKFDPELLASTSFLDVVRKLAN